jgi:hypothetical protein
MPKTAAELDRDIAEALAAAPASGLKKYLRTHKLTVKRAKDFRDSGHYEVRDESGALVALLFRTAGRDWYEATLPGEPQTLYTERWRGSTLAEALSSIARRPRR